MLSKLKYQTESAHGVGMHRPITLNKFKLSTQKKHGIVLISDSHAKGCSEKLSCHLNNSDNSYNVLEVVITSSSNMKIDNLAKNYVTLECTLTVDVFCCILFFLLCCIYNILLCLLCLHVHVLSDRDNDLFHIQLLNDRYWICETCVYVTVRVKYFQAFHTFV
jgi:hypothetical protein